MRGRPAIRVDHALLPELRRYGAFDVDACFNCGTCTAICPLSAEGETFPRRMIRYAQVGMRDQLLASRELWLCYGCSECSETCPRQAEPGDFMAAARRFAVASYDRTGLARMLFTMPRAAGAFAVLLAVVLALFMYSAGAGPMPTERLALFEFIPSGIIHDLGLAVIILVELAGALGLGTMLLAANRRPPPSLASGIAPGAGPDAFTPAGRRGAEAVVRAAWDAIARESLGQLRFRAECDASKATLPWYRRPWFIHASIMWGFLGLLAATMLDYGLEIVGLKPTGTQVPLWYPVRLLGTVAGALLLYGTTLAIVRRLRHEPRSVRRSTPSDWLFLALLWMSGATGFAIEAALYLPSAPAWGYWVFLIHIAVAMELVLLAPFTKFAHAAFRPLALFMRALDREGRTAGGASGGAASGG
jgi:ferredoxin